MSRKVDTRASSALFDLEEGDMVEGGTFMQKVDPAPVQWIVRFKNPRRKEIIVEASWLGVSLGHYRVTPKKVEPA